MIAFAQWNRGWFVFRGGPLPCRVAFLPMIIKTSVVTYCRPRLSDTCMRAQYHECLVVILFMANSWRCSCGCHHPKEAAESIMVDCIDYFIGAVDLALRR